MRERWSVRCCCWCPMRQLRHRAVDRRGRRLRSRGLSKEDRWLVFDERRRPARVAGLAELTLACWLAEGAKVVVNDYGGDSSGHRGSGAMAIAVVDEIVEPAERAGPTDSSDVALEGELVIRIRVDGFGAVQPIVNNAGISGGGTIESIRVEDFDRMEIHLGDHRRDPRRGVSFGMGGSCSSASVVRTAGNTVVHHGHVGVTRTCPRPRRAPAGHHRQRGHAPVFTRLTAQSPKLSRFSVEAASPFVCSLLTDAVPERGDLRRRGGQARSCSAPCPGSPVARRLRITASTASTRPWTPTASTSPATRCMQVLYECTQIGLDLDALTGSRPPGCVSWSHPLMTSWSVVLDYRTRGPQIRATRGHGE